MDNFTANTTGRFDATFATADEAMRFDDAVWGEHFTGDVRVRFTGTQAQAFAAGAVKVAQVGE